MGLTAAVRALHFLALCLLAGGFAFPLFVLPRSGFDARPRADMRAWLARLRAWALLLALLSWLAWLALVAAAMSGRPLVQALSPSVVDTVLRQTRFGHVWVLRLAFLLLLARYIAWPRRTHFVRGTELEGMGAVLLLAVLVSQVWAGHATAAPASHIAVDALHLLAAALWLGMLPPLFVLLHRAGRGAAWQALAAAAARRFSPVGMLAVAVLVITGFINGQMMVGSVHALAGTFYGRLVGAKVLLFAVMLVLAAFNRFLWTPRMQDGADATTATQALWRNVVAEMVLGAAILAIVGVLGASQPAAHEPGMAMPMDHAMAHEPP